MYKSLKMIQFLEILVGFSLDPNICLSVSAGKPGVSEFLIVAEINILFFGEEKTILHRQDIL